MKKAIIVLMIIAVLFMYGCYSYNNDNNPSDEMSYVIENYSFNEIAEHYDNNEIFKYLAEHYDNAKISEYVFEEIGVPNISLIIEELESNGMYDEIGNLFIMADKLGYYPSAIYGQFCIDNRVSLIHLTDSECVVDIPLENRGSVTPMNLQDLKKEIIDNDAYLDKHLLCSVCFPE
jgi:hypothetical protein